MRFFVVFFITFELLYNYSCFYSIIFPYFYHFFSFFHFLAKFYHFFLIFSYNPSFPSLSFPSLTHQKSSFFRFFRVFWVFAHFWRGTPGFGLYSSGRPRRPWRTLEKCRFWAVFGPFLGPFLTPFWALFRPLFGPFLGAPGRGAKTHLFLAQIPC